MERSKLITLTGKNTGVKVVLNPMSDSSVWNILNEWNDLTEIVEVLERRFDKEADNGAAEGLSERLAALKRDAGLTRNKLVFRGYDILFDALAGPVQISSEESVTPDNAEDLQKIFPLRDAKLLEDLYQIVSDYLSSFLPNEDVVKNSERE